MNLRNKKRLNKKVKTLDIYCPLCGACPGGQCRNINNWAFINERPHKERVWCAAHLCETEVI